MFSFQWRNISAQKKADYEARAQMQPTQTDTEVSRHTKYCQIKKSWYYYLFMHGIIISVQRREECLSASRYIIPFKLCAAKTDLT